MQPVSDDAVLLAIFKLGGGEVILILALVLILLGAKKLPDLARGLGLGISEFGKAINEQSEEAGRSVGGIYGKPAAQAITPDNQVAELYDPAVLLHDEEPRKRHKMAGFTNLRRWLRRLVRVIQCLRL